MAIRMNNFGVKLILRFLAEESKAHPSKDLDQMLNQFIRVASYRKLYSLLDELGLKVTAEDRAAVSALEETRERAEIARGHTLYSSEEFRAEQRERNA